MDNPFQVISNRLSNIESLLLDIKHGSYLQPDAKAFDDATPLNVESAADFLGISKQTIYQNIDKIPHKKRFGRLYFFKEELLDYLNDGEGITE
jgi:hypothetical protein